MRSRTLGRTEVRVSEIALGTWGLTEPAYGPVDREAFDRTVAAALEHGVSTFDVAPLWGDGEGERWLGEAIAGHDEAVVITRAGARREDGALVTDFSRDALVEGCEASLERLGREAIDVLLLHNPGEEALRQSESWLQAMGHLEDAGKIRAWGLSATEPELARMALREGAQAVCLPFSLLRPHELKELEPLLGLHSAGLLARHTLGFGMLSGRYGGEHRFGEGDHRSRRWTPSAVKVRARQAKAFSFLEGDVGPDLPTAALRFVLHNRNVSAALVGARSPKQIAHAAEASREPPYMSTEAVYRVRQTMARQRI